MKEITLKVKKMVCGGCENRVKNSLGAIDGVEDVVADHIKEIVKVTLNKEISKEVILQKIEDLGFEVIEEE